MRSRTMTLTALLLCLVAPAARAADQAQPGPIPVVHTWGELLDAEPIAVGGREVRLGIEAGTFAPGGGVLFYCLADAPGWVTDRPGAVGPVSVELEWEGRRNAERIMSAAKRIDRRAQGPVLYVGVVAGATGGKLGVLVRPAGADDEGPCLARRDMAVGGERFHGWTRLVPKWPREQKPEGVDAAQWERDRVRVVQDLGVPHAPFRSGSHPILFDGDVRGRRFRHDRTDPLPTLTPTKPDPALRWTFDGTTATVQSAEPFLDPEPEENLLVRWWVNGEPVIPSPDARQQMMQQMRQIPTDRPKALRLRIQWDPAVIGAKAGDTVRAQLLFCPTGVRPLTQPATQVMMQPMSRELDADYVSRMTDAVEFVVR
jgi:hypothetical protein